MLLKLVPKGRVLKVKIILILLFKNAGPLEKGIEKGAPLSSSDLFMPRRFKCRLSGSFIVSAASLFHSSHSLSSQPFKNKTGWCKMERFDGGMKCGGGKLQWRRSSRLVIDATATTATKRFLGPAQGAWGSIVMVVIGYRQARLQG